MLSGNPSSAKVTYQDVCRSAAGLFMLRLQGDVDPNCIQKQPL